MRFRNATREDLPRLVEIHLAAYPDNLSVAARERNFTHPPFGDLDDLVVVEVKKSIVAHAFLFRMKSAFGGRPLHVGGIASVAVAPESRGRGVALKLMEHLHAVSDARGDAVTMLYPFRQGFYTRLGYAPTSCRKRLLIDTRSIPSSWRNDRVRAMRGGDRARIRALHARAVARSSGALSRPKSYWEKLFLRERRMVLVCGDGQKELSGYVAFTIVQAELHGETTLEVEEMIADDDASRRALFAALSSMRDQADEIVIELAEDDPLDRALVDPDGRRHGSSAVEHLLGEVTLGPMVRLADIPRAIAARGYPVDGAFEVVIDGTALGVRVEDGRAKVVPAQARPAIRASRVGLTAVLYGGLAASHASALGLVTVDAPLLPRLDAMLRIPAVAPTDPF